MSINENNFDDELLSAYLDDELAPEERARVEARLAADPAARQLLDELRAVSRAMKDLPRETLPADLSESVLRRAERAMLATPAHSSGDSASAGGANGFLELARKLPFGRSRRAWVWAGTAIAAGLLIMVIEREPGRDADLRKEVAMGEIRRPLPPLELRAVESPPEAGSTVATDTPEVPAFSAPEPGDDDLLVREELLADSEPARPATSLESIGTLGVELQTRGAVTTDRFGGGGLGGAKPSSASVSDDVAASTPATAGVDIEAVDEGSADAATSRDLLVVHVNVKPEAIDQKLIDGVFARNGIVVEESAKEEVDDVLANESRSDSVSAESSAAAPAAGVRFRASEGKLAKAPPKMDVVLVEAAPAQIFGCLSEIDADHTNYLGIAVDDQMTEANRSQDDKSTVNWKQHDRGVVPGQQRVQVASDNNLYMESDGRQMMLGLEKVAQPAAEQEATAKPGAFGFPAQGRAVRMQQQTYGGRLGDESGEAAYFGSDSGESSPVDGVRRSSEIQNFDLARRSMRKIAAKANTLQVLFVLSAGDEAPQPASSPPADDAVP